MFAVQSRKETTYLGRLNHNATDSTPRWQLPKSLDLVNSGGHSLLATYTG